MVRPSRYTHKFMERFDNFTMTAFPPEYRAGPDLSRNHSGRDENKLAKTKLTPIAADLVSSPTFAEAEAGVECGKLYFTDYQHHNASLNPSSTKSTPAETTTGSTTAKSCGSTGSKSIAAVVLCEIDCVQQMLQAALICPKGSGWRYNLNDNEKECQ